jgi:hypothetical protein
VKAFRKSLEETRLKSFQPAYLPYTSWFMILAMLQRLFAMADSTIAN